MLRTLALVVLVRSSLRGRLRTPLQAGLRVAVAVGLAKLVAPVAIKWNRGKKLRASALSSQSLTLVEIRITAFYEFAYRTVFRASNAGRFFADLTISAISVAIPSIFECTQSTVFLHRGHFVRSSVGVKALEHSLRSYIAIKHL